MKYKLIAMDFDGTLLTSDKKVTIENRNTILKYKNNGYIIVGVTARNLTSVNNVCEISMFNYLILNNGCYIFDVKNKSGINIDNIDEKVAIKITDYFKDISKEIDYCSLHRYYIYKKEKIKNKENLVKINSIDEVKEKIARMNIFLKDSKNINKCKTFLENNFNNINAFIMSNTDDSINKKWLALNPKKTNKSSTLEKLCLRLNININDVIFFGDGANDLTIISKVGLGVAMGNALQEVKNHAKEITLSNDENGIAYFLNKIKIR